MSTINFIKKSIKVLTVNLLIELVKLFHKTNFAITVISHIKLTQIVMFIKILV